MVKISLLLNSSCVIVYRYLHGLSQNKRLWRSTWFLIKLTSHLDRFLMIHSHCVVKVRKQNICHTDLDRRIIHGVQWYILQWMCNAAYSATNLRFYHFGIGISLEYILWRFTTKLFKLLIWYLCASPLFLHLQQMATPDIILLEM